MISDYASDCRIIGIPSPILATIAENRLTTGEVDEKGIESLVKPIMQLSAEEKPDVIVLGCTHYPFIADVLRKLLPDVEFIDSGRAIGRRVRQVLFELGDNAYISPQGSRAYYTGVLTNFAEKETMVRKFGFESLDFFKI